MRDIRFRAWDIEKKQMIVVSDVRITSYCLMLSLEGDLFDEAYNREDDGHVNGKFILMQFTGLHDKNGTPIYEGDILSNKTGRICKVVWFEAQACFDAKPLTSKGTSALFTPNYWRHCEVIGNIYENKE